MYRWSDKVALVTGASAGIGAAVAKQLVQNGMIVVGLARRLDKMEEVKKEMGEVAGRFHIAQGDVSVEKDLERVFKWIADELGQLHVLVNNAGIGREGTIVDGDMSHFKQVLDTNVLGLVSCTQRALRLMNSSRVEHGHIVQINSICGHYVPSVGTSMFNVYAASKHAVTAFTETLRQELALDRSKIKVTSISPGFVFSEFLEARARGSSAPVTADTNRLFHEHNSLSPSDVADSVVYVLSTPAHVQVQELTLRPVGELF